MHQSSNLPAFTFDGASFPVGQLPSGEPGVSVTAMSEHLGLHPGGQKERIQRQAWAKGSCGIMPQETVSNHRDTFGLAANRIPMWLAGITTSKITNPALRERIEHWQVEAADALAAYLQGGRQSIRTVDPTVLALFQSNQEVVLALAGAVGDVRAEVAGLASRVSALEGAAAAPIVQHGWPLPDHWLARDYLRDFKGGKSDPVSPGKLGSEASRIWRREERLRLGLPEGAVRRADGSPLQPPYVRQDKQGRPDPNGTDTPNQYPKHILDEAYDNMLASVGTPRGNVIRLLGRPVKNVAGQASLEDVAGGGQW